MSDPAGAGPGKPLRYDSRATRVSELAVVSFILGFLSIPLDIVFLSGTLVGAVAIILGVIAIRRIHNPRPDDPRFSGKAFAIAGIILGATSLLAGGVGLAILLFGHF